MRASARCLMLLLILAACWNGLPGVSSPPAAHALDDAERLWTVGARAFEDGLYDLSIRMLDRLVDRFPSDPHVGEASLLIGQARLSQKGFQSALDAFRRAQGVTPPPGQPGEPRFWEAETLFRMKRFEEARDLYERVVADHGSSPVAADALYGLAWSDLELKKSDVAVADFRRLLFAYPEHRSAPSATFYLARTLVDLKRPDEAVALLRAFPTKYPGHRLAPDSRYLLGQALLASGDSKEGLSELRAFAANYPNHDLAPQARRLAADAVMKKGSKAELDERVQAAPRAVAADGGGTVRRRGDRLEARAPARCGGRLGASAQGVPRPRPGRARRARAGAGGLHAERVEGRLGAGSVRREQLRVGRAGRGPGAARRERAAAQALSDRLPGLPAGRRGARAGAGPALPLARGHRARHGGAAAVGAGREVLRGSRGEEPRYDAAQLGEGAARRRRRQAQAGRGPAEARAEIGGARAEEVARETSLDPRHPDRGPARLLDRKRAARPRARSRSSCRRPR